MNMRDRMWGVKQLFTYPPFIRWLVTRGGWFIFVFIIVSVLASCDLQTCSWYTGYVERLERCVESPDCTFTYAEFNDYRIAQMRRDANCPAPDCTKIPRKNIDEWSAQCT